MMENEFDKGRNALVQDLQALRIKYEKLIGDESVITGMLCFSTCLIYINMGDESADHILNHAKNEAKTTINRLRKEYKNE